MDICVYDFKYDTIVDGVGIRDSLYVAGCSLKCSGCHNRDAQYITSGTWMSVEGVYVKLADTGNKGVTFCGGEPMEQALALGVLAQLLKDVLGKNIWCYSGYTFEELMGMPDAMRLLKYVDVLVDGRFVKELADGVHPFRGSSNQRLIDVQKSLKREMVVMYSYNCEI